MSEAVTDVIVARSNQPDRLMAMLGWSVAAHVAVAGVAYLLPERPAEAPPVIMTISLGGAPGPKTDGLTQMGGREVQAVSPTPPPRVASPPAPTPPPMTLPEPRARRRPTPVRPERAPPDSTARTPSTGDEARAGSTRTDTRVRGQGFGLASNGGTGGPIVVDAVDFCCTEYLDQMHEIITRNWSQQQGRVGANVMQFTIRRDGTIEGILLERPSGFTVLDLASERALRLTRQLAPLPAQYPNTALTVHLTFVYQR